MRRAFELAFPIHCGCEVRDPMWEPLCYDAEDARGLQLAAKIVQ